MKIIVLLGFLGAARTFPKGIDLSLCSADRMYCFDSITQFIVKVGAHELEKPFRDSVQATTGYGSEYGQQVSNPKINVGSGYLQALQSNIGQAQGNLRLAPECGVDHASVNCKVLGEETVPAEGGIGLQSSLMSTQQVGSTEPLSVQPGIVGQAVSLSGSGLPTSLTDCDDNPIVTQTPSTVCYTKPKKKFLTVQCCKTSKIPIKTEKRQAPCICADGTPAQPLSPLSLSTSPLESVGQSALSLRSGESAQSPSLPGSQMYLNSVMTRNYRKPLTIQLGISENAKIIAEQDRNNIINATQQLYTHQ